MNTLAFTSFCRRIDSYKYCIVMRGFSTNLLEKVRVLICSIGQDCTHNAISVKVSIVLVRSLSPSCALSLNRLPAQSAGWTSGLYPVKYYGRPTDSQPTAVYTLPMTSN